MRLGVLATAIACLGLACTAAATDCADTPGHCGGARSPKVKRPIYNGLQHPVPSFSCCGGHVRCGGSGCVLSGSVTVNFAALQSSSSQRSPEWLTGGLSVECEQHVDTSCPLSKLQSAQRPQFHLGPMLAATQSVNAAKQPVQGKTLILVRRDTDNLYHQMASVLSTFEYMVEVQGGNKTLDRNTEIVFIDGHRGHLTGLLWAPGMVDTAHAIRDVGPTVEQYSRVLLPMYSGAHWWWRGGTTDSATFDLENREELFSAFSATVLAGLHVDPLPTDRTVISLLVRPSGSKRGRGWPSVLKAKDAIEQLIPGHVVEVVQFSDSMPWREQLAQIRKTKLLVSTHGAGLTWSMLLPAAAGVLELLGGGQETQGFYWSLSAWQGRPYRRHQPDALSAASRDWHGDFEEAPKTIARVVVDFLTKIDSVPDLQ